MTTELHPGPDRLLDLVNGLLPTSERSDLLDHLRRCPTCEFALRELAASHEKALAMFTEALFTEALSPARSGPSIRVLAPRHRRRARWRTVSALLAAAAVLVAVLWGTNARRSSPGPSPRGEQMAELVTWLPEPEPTVFQRDATREAADPRIVQGLAAYRDRDARTARRLLSAARANGPLEQVRRIYLGSALLHLGQEHDALETLRAIELAQVPEPWKSETQWLLALAHGETGNTAKADSLYRLLAARPGEIGERARRAQSNEAP